MQTENEISDADDPENGNSLHNTAAPTIKQRVLKQPSTLSISTSSPSSATFDVGSVWKLLSNNQNHVLSSNADANNSASSRNLSSRDQVMPKRRRRKRRRPLGATTNPTDEELSKGEDIDDAIIKEFRREWAAKQVNIDQFSMSSLTLISKNAAATSLNLNDFISWKMRGDYSGSLDIGCWYAGFIIKLENDNLMVKSYEDVGCDIRVFDFSFNDAASMILLSQPAPGSVHRSLPLCIDDDSEIAQWINEKRQSLCQMTSEG